MELEIWVHIMDKDAFHFMLMLLEKAWIHLFSDQLNSFTLFKT